MNKWLSHPLVTGIICKHLIIVLQLFNLPAQIEPAWLTLKEFSYLNAACMCVLHPKGAGLPAHHASKDLVHGFLTFRRKDGTQSLHIVRKLFLLFEKKKKDSKWEIFSWGKSLW